MSRMIRLMITRCKLVQEFACNIAISRHRTPAQIAIEIWGRYRIVTAGSSHHWNKKNLQSIDEQKLYKQMIFYKQWPANKSKTEQVKYELFPNIVSHLVCQVAALERSWHEILKQLHWYFSFLLPETLPQIRTNFRWLDFEPFRFIYLP